MEVEYGTLQDIGSWIRNMTFPESVLDELETDVVTYVVRRNI